MEILGVMVEPAEKQIELEEKLKNHGENIRILWDKRGIVSQIDGLIMKTFLFCMLLHLSI